MLKLSSRNVGLVLSVGVLVFGSSAYYRNAVFAHANVPLFRPAALLFDTQARLQADII
jgi:hypothetical protein